MKLKFILILMLAVTGTLSVFAQKITLEAGYFNPKRFGDFTSETYFDGVKIGAMAEFKLKYNFGFQTGLLYYNAYSNKVQKFSMEGDSVVYNTWTHGLEIPLHIIYNQKLFKDVSIFGFAGPNIQIGINQNLWMTETLSTSLENLTGITAIDGAQNLYQSKLQRINFQLGAGGGVQWKQFILKSGYEWGINNLDRTGVDYVTQGHWYASFAYQIK